jgi:signal transduction histidine kinase
MVLENYNSQLDKNGHRMLTIIGNQAQKMSGMIEELLMLAKKGQLACPLHPVESADVVSNIIEELDGLIKTSQAVVIKKQLPIVRISQNILSQLLGNLVENAVKYAGQNGSPIEISGSRTGDLIRFIVADHGPGIPAEERDSIFNLYYRGDRHEHISGTGVGLASAQKIARMYGGDVWVEETPGGGCTFIVELVECKSDI